jgi:hypothetical protein
MRGASRGVDRLFENDSTLETTLDRIRAIRVVKL